MTKMRDKGYTTKRHSGCDTSEVQSGVKVLRKTPDAHVLRVLPPPAFVPADIRGFVRWANAAAPRPDEPRSPEEKVALAREFLQECGIDLPRATTRTIPELAATINQWRKAAEDVRRALGAIVAGRSVTVIPRGDALLYVERGARGHAYSIDVGVMDDLFRVLERTDLRRLRRCPICERFFYAKRIDAPACSSRCRQTERVRRLRNRERRVLDLLRERQPLPQIAQALGVPITRVRRYIAKSRQRRREASRPKRP